MKEDWYDIDHLYLRNFPNFKIFKVFSNINEFPNEYLDYFSQTAILRQIKYISDFYNSFNGELEREYPYLSKEEMDKFVEEAYRNIYDKLAAKGFL